MFGLGRRDVSEKSLLRDDCGPKFAGPWDIFRMLLCKIFYAGAVDF